MFKPYPGYENKVHPDYLKQQETVIYDFSLKVGESSPSIGIVPSGKVTKIDSVMFEDGCMFDVAVFNVQRMLVAQRQKNRYEARIPFGNEAKGVYFVRIQAGQAVATHKAVHTRNE